MASHSGSLASPQQLGKARERRPSGFANEAQCPVVRPGVNVPSNHQKNVGLNHSTRKQSHEGTEWQSSGLLGGTENPPLPEAQAFLSPVEGIIIEVF